MKIAGRDIGPRHPPYVIGEIAQAHEGSVAVAHAMIDAIADAQADAVKMQCHLAYAESHPSEPWRVEPKWTQDSNRYAYWERMEFSPAAWEDFAEHTHDRGLGFIVSPFSVEAVQLVAPLVDAWKVASGEVTHTELLEAIRAERKPILLSTGMSKWGEILDACHLLRDSEVQVMQCTSAYPCPTSQWGLNLIPRWRGLSDHSGNIYAGLAAVALGCDVIEVHVKMSPYDSGFDAASSLLPEDLTRLCEGAYAIWEAKQHEADKDCMAGVLEPMRQLFMDRKAHR